MAQFEEGKYRPKVGGSSKPGKKSVGRPKSGKVRKQTTVHLSPAVHKPAKVRAAEGETMLSDVVELALMKFLRLGSKEARR